MTYDSFLEILYHWVGRFITVGGGIVVMGYGTFRLFSVKWIDHKFAEALAEFKHLQAQEIEKLRFQINSVLDRITRLNDKEFEVLPEAWGKLNDAFWKAEAFVAVARSYPDLERMSQPQFISFLQSCRLDDWERSALANSQSRNKYYMDQIYWHDRKEVLDVARDLNTYLSKQSIFLKSEIRDEFEMLAELIWEAISEYQTNHDIEFQSQRREKYDAFKARGDDMRQALSDRVHKRLHDFDLGARIGAE